MTNKEYGDLLINGKTVTYSGKISPSIKEPIAEVSFLKDTNKQVLENAIRYCDEKNTTSFQYGDDFFDNVYFEVVEEDNEIVKVYAYRATSF